MHGEALPVSRVTPLDWAVLAGGGAKRILVPEKNKQAFEDGKLNFPPEAQAAAPEWHGYTDVWDTIPLAFPTLAQQVTQAEVVRGSMAAEIQDSMTMNRKRPRS